MHCVCTCVDAAIYKRVPASSPRVQVEERFRQIKADEHRRKLQQQYLIDDFTDDIFQETRMEEVRINLKKITLTNVYKPLAFTQPQRRAKLLRLKAQTDEAARDERRHRVWFPTVDTILIGHTLPSTSPASTTQQAEGYKVLFAASTMLKKKVRAQFRVTCVIAIVSRDCVICRWKACAGENATKVAWTSKRKLKRR